jgi:hypothetical protein
MSVATNASQSRFIQCFHQPMTGDNHYRHQNEARVFSESGFVPRRRAMLVAGGRNGMICAAHRREDSALSRVAKSSATAL